MHKFINLRFNIYSSWQIILFIKKFRFWSNRRTTLLTSFNAPASLFQSMVTYNGLLLEKFAADRDDENYCDVTLNVSGTKFKCHKFLLGTVSRHFHRLFNGRFKESTSDEISITTPHGLTSSTFEEVITFIYTENTALLNQDNVITTLLAANHFEILHLENECVEFLIENMLTPETWMSVYRVAYQLSLKTLLQRCSGKFLKFVCN